MSESTCTVRVQLPSPLRALLNLSGELSVCVQGEGTLKDVLDALEQTYPALRGTLRDHGTHKRRAFVRFYACARDISLEPADTLLPMVIREGREPLLVIGAMAGG